MRHLSPPDIARGVRDLLENRIEAARLCRVGKTYAKPIERRLRQLEALLEETDMEAAQAKAAELQAACQGWAAAIGSLNNVYLEVPQLDEELRAAAQRIGEGLEAGEEGALESLREDLERFPVAGGSAWDWASELLACAAELGELQGAEEADPAKLEEAANIAQGVLGLLFRVRTGIENELKTNPNLPADLEEQVFGYIDELAAQAEE